MLDLPGILGKKRAYKEEICPRWATSPIATFRGEEMGESIKDWIPLINKMVWPAFIVVFLLIFHGQVREVYSVVLDGVRNNRAS